MERVMVKSILGRAHGEVDRDTFERVSQQSRDFIDKTTGIQTLKQMHGLVAHGPRGRICARFGDP
jgi:hypothetical protein